MKPFAFGTMTVFDLILDPPGGDGLTVGKSWTYLVLRHTEVC